jgi:hypothetical protein
MPTPDGPQFEQLQLFDDAPYKHKKDRGEMSMDEWLRTQKPVYHGTFREDFHQAPTAHYGTIGQASTMVRNKGLTYDNSVVEDDYDNYDDDDADLPEHSPTAGDHGRVYARRLTEKPHSTLFKDRVANAGDVAYRYLDSEEEYEIPRSLKSSAGGLMPDLQTDGRDNPVVRHKSEKAEEATSALSEGKPIKYTNEIEGYNTFDNRNYFDGKPTPMSIVAPRNAVTSWERDVIASPRASDAAKRYAQQRMSSGREGSVAFPIGKKSEMKQPTMISPSSTEPRRLGNWGVRVAKNFPRYSEVTADQVKENN